MLIVLERIRRRRYNLIPAESKFKNLVLDHQDKYMMKAQMGTFRETLADGDEGALHLGPERPQLYSDLSPEEKERYNADIRATNILLQGLPKDIYTLINCYTDAKDI
uniref:Integrase, catalytic region, zinc finger, CCHC-type, peptidase aspartic, catalytic n=1 Tax=Tanacetum cinerariifolium TaxID=118510 RepID=A0A699KSP4_TANCI|nr:integrase, catalytic region, zinc finger, CCHC-type, peptidase aspartic, catalytic [Tanacetum cinerariifolium]